MDTMCISSEQYHFIFQVLDISNDDILISFRAGLTNLTAVCLGGGYPTIASVPHSVVNGFQNLMAIAAVTDVTFKEAELLKEILSVSNFHDLQFPQD